MRRIYESRALDREDSNPYKPNERDEKQKPQAARTLPSETLSRWFVPAWVRYRAISVTVSTPQSVYEPQTPIPISITMRNRMPFPVTLPTRSPMLWSWHVDGLQEASHVATDSTGEPKTFHFDRGECKQFRRHWHQLFQVSDTEWEESHPGEYTISAEINIKKAAERDLTDQTTVRIEKTTAQSRS